jgi:hypothetical protein
LKRDREEPSAEDAAKANNKKRKLQELKDKKKEPHIWAANDKKGGAVVPTGAAAQCKWLFDSYVEAMTKVCCASILSLAIQRQNKRNSDKCNDRHDHLLLSPP